jgi:hypothetical protein
VELMLPLETILAEHRELGLMLAVLLGFGFGFVLERAGFGQATKLAAQFYLHDMTVFKVMFSSIITAMLGVMVAAGFGLVNLQALSESAVSATFLWPHLVGGLLLGAGFIISGYCPGTSAVATASGNIDGLLTFAGVIVGSLIYGEVFPLLASFHTSGEQGHMFLYELVGLEPQVLAMLVTLMAIGMFIGAERVERIFSRKRNGGNEPSPSPRRPRRLVFGALAGLTVLALATLAVPTAIQAEARSSIGAIDQHQLARRVLDEPWRLRILDLRQRAACVKQRIPGAECAPLDSLDKLGLPFGSGGRDLVLVPAKELKSVPEAARRYPGRVLVLDGGFAGWSAFALTRPEPPAAEASAADKQRYSFRVALHSAMTGRKPPPPPPANKKYAPKPKKKKGGGCS